MNGFILRVDSRDETPVEVIDRIYIKQVSTMPNIGQFSGTLTESINCSHELLHDIVKELKEYGITPVIADPEADAAEAKALYGIEFVDINTIKDMDAVIMAVAHREFSAFTIEQMDALFGVGKKVLLDIKGLLERREYETANYSYWRL